MFTLPEYDLKELQGAVLALMQQKNSSNAIRRIDNTLKCGYTVAIYDVGDILRIDIKHDKKADS